MAKLTFIYGAMNSGKSDSLIKTAYNYTEQGLQVVTIKPRADTKHKTDITARAGGCWKVDLLADPSSDIEKFITNLLDKKRIHCILVDEAQFLTPEQIDQLYSIAKSHHVSVVAFGLRTDFQTKMFAGSKRLLELADTIDKLVTMCRCGEQAEFNCRMINNAPIFDGGQIAIDGQTKTTYNSLCGSCYNSEKMRYTSKKKEAYV